MQNWMQMLGGQMPQMQQPTGSASIPAQDPRMSALAQLFQQVSPPPQGMSNAAAPGAMPAQSPVPQQLRGVEPTVASLQLSPEHLGMLAALLMSSLGEPDMPRVKKENRYHDIIGRK